MLSTVFSAGLFGIDGFLVSVECNGYKNIPSFDIVGLPDTAVREARERRPRRSLPAESAPKANSILLR